MDRIYVEPSRCFCRIKRRLKNDYLNLIDNAANSDILGSVVSEWYVVAVDHLSLFTRALLSSLPLVDSKAETAEQQDAKNAKYYNPDPVLALLDRLFEGVLSSRKGFSSNVNVADSV